MSSQTNEVVREAVERIVQSFQPLRIAIFDSHTADTTAAIIDIKLLVVFDEFDDRRAKSVAIRRALADLPVSKNIVVTTPAEITARGHLVGSVLRHAIREGQMLYERP